MVASMSGRTAIDDDTVLVAPELADRVRLIRLDHSTALVLRPSARKWLVFRKSGVTTGGTLASAIADTGVGLGRDTTRLYGRLIRDLWRHHPDFFDRFIGLTYPYLVWIKQWGSASEAAR